MQRPDGSFNPSAYELGTGNDIGVLLIHGFTASATETRPVADYILQRHPDWRCRGILLPGHGQTPEALEATSDSDWLSAAEASYADLANCCRHVFLVGVSMGAVLSCHVALKHAAGAKISGIVLMAPAFGLGSIQTAGVRLLKPFLRFVSKGSAKVNYFIDKRIFSYAVVPLRRVDDVLKLGHAALHRLTELRNTPVLMFAGSKERTVSLSAIQQAAKRNPWINFQELPASEHILTVEPDQQQLFEKTLAFMEDIYARGGR
jgi:carboxylesterase